MGKGAAKGYVVGAAATLYQPTGREEGETGEWQESNHRIEEDHFPTLSSVGCRREAGC